MLNINKYKNKNKINDSVIKLYNLYIIENYNYKGSIELISLLKTILIENDKSIEDKPDKEFMTFDNKPEY